MTTRHQFLAALHQLLRPKVYLEIGVQHGTSLALATPPTYAYGVDPNPLVNHPGLFRMTSDQFFSIIGDDNRDGMLGGPVDLGFVDGMHLAEFALRDFIGLERICHHPTWRPARSDLVSPVQVRPSPSVIVFDDVLPTTRAMAARTQCPGDWTGDVWRVEAILSTFRPDLDTLLVDTAPTGLLIVRNVNPADRVLTARAADIATRWPAEDQHVPDEILRRERAWGAQAALDEIVDWWRIVSAQPTQQEVAP